jgi:hypothetical protein
VGFGDHFVVDLKVSFLVRLDYRGGQGLGIFFKDKCLNTWPIYVLGIGVVLLVFMKDDLMAPFVELLVIFLHEFICIICGISD